VKHTLVALMQDHPGVLTRVVSLFRRRGFNIESLAVGHSETPGISRMTLVVDAADVEQVIKQLYRLIEVLKVSDVTSDPCVDRELALIKVHATKASRAEIVALTSVFEARVVDVGATSMVIEITGTPAKVDNLIELLRPFGLREMMRTGRISMVRGARTNRVAGEVAPVAEREAVPPLAAVG
jgi:acetolactate synthase I/III small subunit